MCMKDLEDALIKLVGEVLQGLRQLTDASVPKASSTSLVCRAARF